MTDRRYDFDQIEDATRIVLYPRPENPLHSNPIEAMCTGGYFYCDGTPPIEGPDYYLGDVLAYCDGYSLVRKP